MMGRTPDEQRGVMTDAAEKAPPGIDTSRPHSARVYDYFLGGKNHFAADRELATLVLRSAPHARTAARENREFLGRAIKFLAAEAGIRQFLDIGTGLPTAENVHQVAQQADPSSRIVYVDNDPLVLAHARALLTSAPEGRTAYIDADLRDPAAILASPATTGTLDLTKPVALSMVSVLHFLQDEDEASQILKTLISALAPGSYVVASHITAEHDPKGVLGGQSAVRGAGITAQARDSDVFGRLVFSSLDLVPPGVVLVSDWRRSPGTRRPAPAEVNYYGAVARKP
jgi:hypothetical protein